MTAKRTCRQLVLTLFVLMIALGDRAFAQSASDSFREMLITAGLDPEMLAPLAAQTEYNVDDWQVLSQLVYRLRHFPTAQLRNWSRGAARQTGDLLELTATVTKVEPAPIPEGMSEESEMRMLYRCHFEAAGGASGSLLVPRVPRWWQNRTITAEPVRFFGVLLGTTPTGEQLFVASHLSWFPQFGVPSGWLLLAREGMDVALLDEVRHRQPFVKPDVSREGEAFYQALAALAKVNRQELAKLTLANVDAVVNRFRETMSNSQERVAELRRQLAAEDAVDREALQQQLSAARRELALAEAVERQGEQRLSSVAPMFLEPEASVGELVRIEGVARRAVRIAVAESPDRPPGLDAYYELEVFTPDSQNLPVVCCVARLPAGFPTGDAIHEPARVDGVFFKFWRYRSRKNLATNGETGRAQQLYTPVVVGGEPRQLPTATNVDSRWGLGGGIAFLAVLAAIWITALRAAERDRQRRAATAPVHLEDMPEGP